MNKYFLLNEQKVSKKKFDCLNSEEKEVIKSYKGGQILWLEN